MKTIMLWCAMLFALYGECYAGFGILSWEPGVDAYGMPDSDHASHGYKIYMSTVSGGPYTTPTDVGQAVLTSEPCITQFNGCIVRTYTVYGLVPGMTYFWMVTAYDTAGNESDYSNEVYKAILPDALLPGDATLFSATPYATGVRLSWTNPPDQDLVRVILEYNFSGGSFITLAMLKAVPGKAQTYDHLGLMPGIYSYALHTRDSSGNTTHTAHASATINDTEQPTTTETTISNQQQPTTLPSSGSNDGGGGCFIATAAYGSYLDPHVMILRQFRDDYLLTNAPGRAFVAAYYTVSPPIADFIARHSGIKTVVRIWLTPMIFALEYPISAALMFTALFGAVFGLHRKKR